MSIIKDFKVDALNICNSLVGKKLYDVFKQLDFFVFNFGEGIEYCLHTYCFTKITKNSEILLSCIDEYLRPNHTLMTDEEYSFDELHQNSLLKNSIEHVKSELATAYVSCVKISGTGDLYIIFDNGIVLENHVASVREGEEFYRIFKYKDLEGFHYVVKYLNKKVVIELI